MHFTGICLPWQPGKLSEFSCQAKSLPTRLFLRQTPNPTASEAAKRASVPGSGTAATTPAGRAATIVADAATREPVSVGSKMKVPPAPTVRLEPTGMAPESFAIKIPLSTYVPPP